MIVVSRGIFDKIETVLLRETRNKDGNIRMEIMKSKLYIINRFNSEEKILKNRWSWVIFVRFSTTKFEKSVSLL